MHGSLPTRLRVLRAERGLTLRDAEHETGVDKDTLSKIERGLRHPHDVTLAKIAKGYDVPVEDLLEEPALAGTPGKAEAPREAGLTKMPLASAVETIGEFLQARTNTAFLALPDAEWDRWWLGVPRNEVVGRFKQIEAEWQLLKYEWAAIVQGEPSVLRREDALEAFSKMYLRVGEARYSVPREEESDEEFQRRRLEGKQFRTFYEPLEQVWPVPEELPGEEGSAS